MADDQLTRRTNTEKTSTVHRCLSRHHREVKKRAPNKASIVLILYSVPAFCCLMILKTVALSLVDDHSRAGDCFEVEQDDPAATIGGYIGVPNREVVSEYALRTLQTTVTYLAFPVMGWVAEVFIGRTKIVSFSLYSMWVGMIFITLSYALESPAVTCGAKFKYIKYFGIIIGLIYLIIGTAGFFANILAYILEQMISEPSDKLRASVNWVTWSLFVGVTVKFFVLPQNAIYGSTLSRVGMSLLITFLLTVTIVINSNTSCLIKVGTPKVNPSKLIWDVMVYAVKQPVAKRRSALSYWDKEKPGRLDFAKERNGGPHTDEEVEDVKSFWQISMVVCSLIGFYIPFSKISDDGIGLLELYKDSTHFLNSHILFALFFSMLLILIPVFELVLIPCFPRLEYWMQNSLRGLGVGYVLLLLSLISMLILDIIGYHQLQPRHKSNSEPNHESPDSKQYPVSFMWYSIPVGLFCLAYLTNILFSIQFLMSQAPLRMCGVLTGMYWLLRALGSNISIMIEIPFDVKQIPSSSPVSASFWSILIHIAICFIGMLCYVKVSLWYRRRRKNVTFLTKEVIEEYFERQMNESSMEISYPPLLTKSVDYFNYEAAIQNISNPGIQNK